MSAIGKPVREIVAEPLEWPLPRKVDIPDAPTIWTPDKTPVWTPEPVKVPERVKN